MRFLGVILSVFLGSFSLCAQTDPVDKNHSGPFVGGDFSIVRGSTTEGQTGFGYGGALNLGYVVKRDTWNRFEFGIELGSDRLDLGGKAVDGDVAFNTNFLAMIKGGYGYSLGGNAFGVWRLGVGLAETQIGDKDGSKGDGFVARLGWDAVIPMDHAMSFVVGVYAQKTESRFDSASYDDISLNAIAIHGGVRLGN